MNATELSDKIDELEIQRAEARSAVDMARRAVVTAGIPETASTAAWMAYQATVERVVERAAELDAIETHLVVAAELEQALKEGRWDDVATWASRLSVIENETIQAVTPERTPRMEMTWRLGRATDAERCATDLRNRGLFVAEAEDGRTLTVEAPSGWTGTSPLDVAKAHNVERVETAEGVTSQVLYRRPADKLSPCPGVPHRNLPNETTCVVSGGIIGEGGQCEVHEGA